jgi:hypothetical protein
MKRMAVLLVSVALTLTACGGRPTLPPPTATLPPSPTPFPSPTATPGTPYADAVVAFQRGPGGYEEDFFTDPQAVLGAPDVVTDPCCQGLFSLGTGGFTTVQFTDNAAVDGPGPDLYIYGDPSNDEHLIVEVSADGNTWQSFGVVPEVAELDLQAAGLAVVHYVRISDDAIAETVIGTDGQPHENNSAEVDAVEALND